jgi:hypothetical protein
MLERKVKCGYCEHALSAKKTKGEIVYRCDTHLVAREHKCFKGTVSEADIIETVLTALRQHAELAVDAEILRKANGKTAKATAETLRGEALNLRKLIEKSKTAKMTLWERYNSGQLSREKFQSESAQITEQVAAYEMKADDLEAEARKLELVSDSGGAMTERLCKLTGIVELTPEILAEFVQRINVYAPDRIDVVFNFADPMGQISSTQSQI